VWLLIGTPIDKPFAIEAALFDNLHAAVGVYVIGTANVGHLQGVILAVAMPAIGHHCNINAQSGS
jgi:hypothetical protein